MTVNPSQPGLSLETTQIDVPSPKQSLNPSECSSFRHVKRRFADVGALGNFSLRRLEVTLEKSADRRTVVVLGSEWSSDKYVVEILDGFPITAVVPIGSGGYFRTSPMRHRRMDPLGFVHVGDGTRENLPAAQSFIDDSVAAWIRASGEDLEIVAIDSVGKRSRAAEPDRKANGLPHRAPRTM